MRYPSLKGTDPKFRRNHRHALHGTMKALVSYRQSAESGRFCCLWITDTGVEGIERGKTGNSMIWHWEWSEGSASGFVGILGNTVENVDGEFGKMLLWRRITCHRQVLNNTNSYKKSRNRNLLTPQRSYHDWGHKASYTQPVQFIQSACNDILDWGTVYSTAFVCTASSLVPMLVCWRISFSCQEESNPSITKHSCSSYSNAGVHGDRVTYTVF